MKAYQLLVYIDPTKDKSLPLWCRQFGHIVNGHAMTEEEARKLCADNGLEFVSLQNQQV